MDPLQACITVSSGKQQFNSFVQVFKPIDSVWYLIDENFKGFSTNNNLVESNDGCDAIYQFRNKENFERRDH